MDPQWQKGEYSQVCGYFFAIVIVFYDQLFQYKHRNGFYFCERRKLDCPLHDKLA